MFRHNFVGGLSPFLGILVLASACVGGQIGDAAGVSRLGPGDDGSQPVAPGTQVAPACLGASPDVSASNGWRSSEASLPASDSLYFEFKARPATANLDGLVGVGAEDIDDFTKAAIAVRFAEDGLVDARDGSFYSSDVSYPYDPGVWYTVAISANISTETYDVAIGPCGEPRETLIKGASFRYDANVSDQLSTWAVWSSQAAALELSTPTWMASGGCVPATCQSLGHECGQPSDGCGGSLDCGGCESGNTCASGLCVNNSTPPPPVEPTPPPPPGGGGQSERPLAHNTGPSGTLNPWSYGSKTLTTDGATYENFRGGAVKIDADNVTLRNFAISGGLYGIKIESGHSGIVIEDGEISNTGTGILGVGYTGRRLYIHDQQHDGTKVQGSGGPTLVEYSFMEKMGMADGSHADGNQTQSGSNITFRYNNIWLPAVGPNYPGGPYKSNAAFMNSGTITNFVIENNWLNGGNNTIYCQQGGTNVSGISVRNNRFGRDYRYGTISGTCDVNTGNVWDDTGGPI